MQKRKIKQLLRKSLAMDSSEVPDSHYYDYDDLFQHFEKNNKNREITKMRVYKL